MAAQNGTKVADITTDADFSNQISSLPASALSVIYFHTPWAEPCKQMSTVLGALASTYSVQSPVSIAFFSLDAEELPDISEKYDVTAVPYLVLEKNGQILDTVSGSDASKVRAAVERHAGQTNSGKLGLPPAQTVTRAEHAPVQKNGHAAADESGTQDMSAYAPDASDPKTAPQYSSDEKREENKEQMFKRLEGLTKSAPVMLFMKGTPSAPQCGFSRRTVALLRSKSVRYGFFDILADDEVRQGLKEYADWPTFPQLWVDGELVGGLDIVKEEFENNDDFLNEYSAKPRETTAAA